MSTPSEDRPTTLRPEHVTPRPLTDLADVVGGTGVRASDTWGDVLVSGVTIATDDVLPGDVFVALQGAHQHGAAFAAKAAARGAVAIVTDDAGAALAESAGLPIIVVVDPRARLGMLAAWVYDTSDNLPLLFGTTGTNGKTSVTHIIDAVLTQLGVPTGVSSTVRRQIDADGVVSRLTTPEASEVHALLARVRERQVQAMAIEVSAQALVRHRVDGVVFDVVGFTNLSHEHLDDFGDMESYYKAKASLFTPERARRAVVSLDSPAGLTCAADATVPVVTVGTPDIADDPVRASGADWIVRITGEEAARTSFELTGPDGFTMTTSIPLIGSYMAANAGLALVMLFEAGFDRDAIAGALSRDGGITVSIPGRMDVLSGAAGPVFLLDYAHTPDAFEKALLSVRGVTTGRIAIIIALDGDRDPSKRFDMGRIAAIHCDAVFATDHHPRFEDPEVIRGMAMEGARAAGRDIVLVATSPTDAVTEAVRMLGPGDAILWAGPGHERYRDVRGEYLDYSPRDVARAALADAGWPPAPGDDS